MRRLPGIALATAATLIVIVALLVSALRLAMPHLDQFRPRLVSWAQSATGVPLDMASIQGRWEPFGPALEIRNLSASTPDADWRIERVTLALDVWQSLLRGRWQFRDLTFYQLRLDLNATLTGQRPDGGMMASDKLSDLFLRQFDHFDLRDSYIAFLTPSGAQAELNIPQLTWLNQRERHRAEGQIGLSTFTGQHGIVQVRMDLHDSNELLNNGTVYLQADDIDMKPWFGRWLRNKTGLESADFSLAAWLQIRDGDIASGDVLLNKGAASWRVNEQQHRLDVDAMTVHIDRQAQGWQFDIPALNLATDGERWPRGRVSALWLPQAQAEQELRIRAGNLTLERVGPLLPLLNGTTPALTERWQALAPAGSLDRLALDIPLDRPEQTRFQLAWRDVSWRPWQYVPGMQHFSGALSGSAAHGRLDLALDNSTLPYDRMFRAPLEIGRARGALTWRHDPQGWSLQSRGLDVQAKSLWVNGDFDYQQPAQGDPRLSVLAGIRLSDAADAWRYYPEPLMGAEVADYLSGALKGGRVDNATLIFNGNPQHFPWPQHDGQFEVQVPLRQATFEFQPGWPALTDLDIDLDFANSGLWMTAPQIWLGKVEGKNIRAVIPDYRQRKLLIDGDLSGNGVDVGKYFLQTSMSESLGSVLNRQLRIDGMVRSKLHLDIPLDGEEVQASGNVVLNNNRLTIDALNSTISNLSGQFWYRNGDLSSDPLQGNWLGQPVALSFTTAEQEKGFQVNVELAGDWSPARLPGLPKAAAAQLSGSVPWKSQVAINLPHKGSPSYEVDLRADLKKVSSHLLLPLEKSAGNGLTLQAKAKGGMHGFILSGSSGKDSLFNSEWSLGNHSIALTRGRWQRGVKKIPALPEQSEFEMNLPALDGENWLALWSALGTSEGGKTGGMANFRLPARMTLRTPALRLFGQQWHDLSISSANAFNGVDVALRGKEIDMRLSAAGSGAWRSAIRYLYYNPQWQNDEPTSPVALAQQRSPLNTRSIRFQDWPALEIDCQQCWIMGQNFGHIQAKLTPQQDKLLLSDGVVDTGKARMTVEGSWQQGPEGARTALKGRLSGDSLDANAAWFGVETPLNANNFTVDYDLYWGGEPWRPDIPTLSGVLHSQIGKGHIANVGAGQAGQLLRLVSFDSLLRKLQFDFSDTFSKGFWFDSVRSTSWIKDGVLHTDDTLVDGLEADIAMRGQVDLVRRQIEMEAVIAPEISATVGVATAFVINPVVGAAVFAASKVLAPLWNKISLIRYQISGSLDQPKVKEVLREPHKAPARQDYPQEAQSAPSASSNKE
ncbi:AsmA2 domain-containing protein [Affinibrenneria salicis]|uniref:AsmA2 domain-containing protein n=1 Tax=Affinibrenneria salicis TaxID=2590031 RepID=A0A5J5FYB1_9GAMM|nr:AsmA2 domain-containing protein YhdP [Affinibrenneria salicis]KAA8999221.1 AsmA2 domain-containing protein [Affinibrenneria salicis]